MGNYLSFRAEPMSKAMVVPVLSGHRLPSVAATPSSHAPPSTAWRASRIVGQLEERLAAPRRAAPTAAPKTKPTTMPTTM
jgi:hypothetical protein